MCSSSLNSNLSQFSCYQNKQFSSILSNYLLINFKHFSFLFSLFSISRTEFSDYILICFCIWFLSVQHSLAHPTNLFKMQQRSLESKLQFPCGVNYITPEEDMSPAELKALFNVICTQTRIAYDQADKDIKNYVCILCEFMIMYSSYDIRDASACILLQTLRVVKIVPLCQIKFQTIVCGMPGNGVAISPILESRMRQKLVQ